MLKRRSKPESIEQFIASLPDNAEATFRAIYRHGGRLHRYELKYVQYGQWGRRATERYTYTGDTPMDCIIKLRKKQSNPGCRVDCTCNHHVEVDND